MRYYMAPMEGVTGWVYRNAFHRHFTGPDKYYMPFLSPRSEHHFSKKELQDVLPEHNAGLSAVPQLMTRSAEDFVWAAGELGRMGYREVNLNLGCPSGTVVAKGKGSGLLARPEELDAFLDGIYSAPLDVSVTVKTRLGLRAPEEFEALLEVFGKYPIPELTVHPRVQKDFYKNHARPEWFARAWEVSPAPLCYNGDLVSLADCRAAAARFPGIEALMLGRRLIANPGLISRLRGGPGTDRDALRAFHDELYQGYCETFHSRRNAVMRMKEVWFYLIHLFRDSERHAKKLRKAADPSEYEARAAAVFRDLELLEDPALFQTDTGW